MTHRHYHIEAFLRKLRESSNLIEELYLNGGCYRLYSLLKHIYPDAAAYYNSDHVITEIEGRFYDIRGEVTETDRYIPMDFVDMLCAETYSPEYDLSLMNRLPGGWALRSEFLPN